MAVGYEGSSPVRTGNAAAGQLQLDVWGETLDALFLARQAGLPADRDAWALQVALMNYLESAWREPDNGLWEVRGDRQHFTHSKVIAWAAADRMARSVRAYGLPGPAPRWEALREQIRRDVITRGFDAGRNTFTQAYGSAALDASLLLIPRVGFLPATDPRVMGTIAAVRRELSDGGLVRRYRPLRPTTASRAAKACSLPARSGSSTRCTPPGSSGTPSTCSSGCCSAQRRRAAQRGMGPGRTAQLGNTPQAFSHFALVVSALQLHMGGAVRSDHPMHDRQPASSGDRPDHPDRVRP